jgi:hypothetical protein
MTTLRALEGSGARVGVSRSHCGAYAGSDRLQSAGLPLKTCCTGSRPIAEWGRGKIDHRPGPHLAAGLPAGSENAYHSRQFRFHPGDPGLTGCARKLPQPAPMRSWLAGIPVPSANSNGAHAGFLRGQRLLRRLRLAAPWPPGNLDQHDAVRVQILITAHRAAPRRESSEGPPAKMHPSGPVRLPDCPENRYHPLQVQGSSGVSRLKSLLDS